MTETKIIPIEYTRAEGFRYLPATGAVGGINPNGEMICNFFIEHLSLPKNQQIIAEKNQGLKEERGPEPDRKAIREIQMAIVLRPDIAKSIGEWMIQEAEKVLLAHPPAKGINKQPI